MQPTEVIPAAESVATVPAVSVTSTRRHVRKGSGQRVEVVTTLGSPSTVVEHQTVKVVRIGHVLSIVALDRSRHFANVDS